MTALGGRVALVTGASRGIGAAVALALRDAGASVIRIARTLTPGARDGFHDVACDLTDTAQAAAILEAVVEAHGVPDIVVSSAGAFLLRPLDATTPADFQAQLAANLVAPFLLARAVLPRMRRAGRGLFISVGSIVDHVGYPENAAYAASKYGLRGLHETLLAEYRGSGVRLTLVSPGPTDTAVWDPIRPDEREGFIRRADMLRPSDVADAVLYVATRPSHVHIDWVRLNPAS
ncbi:MAG TPA: SDR family oxidoreductase [Gemmatimonadales bacterium]|nr:SDR family oxidoreductase [Gemmatimonadales bacterium]